MIYFLIAFVWMVLVTILSIALLNAVTFLRLRPPPPEPERPVVYPAVGKPKLSVLIPARNEANSIADTVRLLLAQTYPNFEVLILDDGSTDGTPDIARAVAQGDPRLRILAGQPLLAGWLGKNWACHQLAQAARGDWLIFTDADVRWQPEALAGLVALADQAGADLLTVWPTQITVSRAERWVVPLIALAIMGYLPAWAVHHLHYASLAAANGQCLAFRRAAYNAVGGHVAVRASVIEDITFARLIKAKGLNLRMADGAGLIACRMYRTWREVRDGFAKNILAGYGGRVSLLLLATAFHWLIFLLPWVWLLLGWRAPQINGWPWLPLLLCAFGIAARALTAAITRQNLRDALALPISVLLMTVIAFQAIWWQWRYGGPRWKDRQLRI